MQARVCWAGIGAGIEASDDDGWEVGTDSPRYLYGAPRVTCPRVQPGTWATFWRSILINDGY